MLEIEKKNKIEDLSRSFSNYEFNEENQIKRKNLVLMGLSLISDVTFDDYSTICTYCMERIFPQLLDFVPSNDHVKDLEEILFGIAKFVKEKYIRTNSLLDREYAILRHYEEPGLSDREIFHKISLNIMDIYEIEKFNDEYSRKMDAHSAIITKANDDLKEWMSKIDTLNKN